MTKKEGCQCFSCRFHNEPRLIAAHELGFQQASEWFLNWAKRHNLKSGSIADDDLPGIIAQMECNYTESLSYCDSPEILKYYKEMIGID